MASLAQAAPAGWLANGPGRKRAGPGTGRESGVAESALDPEARLVARCLDGEEAAWEELARTYTKRVYSMCYRFTGNDAVAQDLTQEVFLRLYRGLKSFRSGEGNFGTWLARLTRNLLIDHYRRSRMDRATDSIEDQLPLLESSGPGGGHADALLGEREASEIVQKGLQRLSPELRETVILRDLEGMEYREIAEVLSIPEGTVKSRLNRGRAELARVLRQYKVLA